MRTEESYLQWIKRFILFHDKRHPMEMGEQEITAFLTFLAVDKHVAPSTQNQAHSAQELDWMDDIVRAKPVERIPGVLSPDQVRQLINQLEGTYQLMARLLYGTGMRLMEAVRLRVRARKTGTERLRMGVSMFEAARVMVLASLPPELSEWKMRRRLCARFYGERADKVYGGRERGSFGNAAG